MITAQLAACVGCSSTRAEQWLPHIDEAMQAYAINTPARQAAFLAQIGHESGHLVYVKELWGPTPQQQRYERHFDAAWPPSPADLTNKLAFGLGNMQIGDGSKFKGRGLIQITGRTNYRAVGEDLGLTLETHPEQLELAKYAALSAAWFWDQHSLNELADNGEFETITRRINGGTNGLAERLELWGKAKQVLSC